MASFNRRGRLKSPTMTATVAGFIKWLWTNTNLNQAQIAAKFDVNQGRVSEVISGKRFATIAPLEFKGDY
ncbi:hypothetical protein [Aestuariibius sp. HNIBRBA575]|uniref:hypothetical protein n=1 Tax=Aestuariibius sp. HNIBRBA575 TaxID=3233343 RepID=UPI0034A4AC13